MNVLNDDMRVFKMCKVNVWRIIRHQIMGRKTPSIIYMSIINGTTGHVKIFFTSKDVFNNKAEISLENGIQTLGQFNWSVFK